MNRALWSKTWHEGKWLLFGSAAMLTMFLWIRVWISSKFEVRQMRRILHWIPDFIQDLFPVPLDVVASPAGRIAVGYDDPLVLTVISIWAIARGSDSVSGEVGRGTMEMLLAQPVRRSSVIFSHAAITTVGAAFLAFSAWLGTWIGLRTITLEETVSAQIFLPAALNLFSLCVFLAGLTTLISSADRYRSRTIGIVVAFYAIQMTFKLVAISVPDWSWLRNLTFLSAFEPQVLAHAFWPTPPEPSLAFWPTTSATSVTSPWLTLLMYNGFLVGVGLVCYSVATVIFARRDLPAPL